MQSHFYFLPLGLINPAGFSLSLSLFSSNLLTSLTCQNNRTPGIFLLACSLRPCSHGLAHIAQWSKMNRLNSPATLLGQEGWQGCVPMAPARTCHISKQLPSQTPEKASTPTHYTSTVGCSSRFFFLFFLHVRNS